MHEAGVYHPRGVLKRVEGARINRVTVIVSIPKEKEKKEKKKLLPFEKSLIAELHRGTIVYDLSMLRGLDSGIVTCKRIYQRISINFRIVLRVFIFISMLSDISRINPLCKSSIR